MTNSYIKLAEELDFVSRLHISEDYPCANASLAEAARILRAAAAADVQGLMAKAMLLVSAVDESCNKVSSVPFAEAVADLEAALRVALAGREPDKLDAQIHDSSSTHVYATVEAACWGEYTIDASRDDESRNWHITVTAPSGIRDYDGYWRNSDFKTADDVVNEAIRGACLTGLAAAQPGAQEQKP